MVKLLSGEGLRGRALGLATAVAVAVGFSASAQSGVFNPETFTLDNGMEVVVIPNHRAPVVSHMVYYRVGAADEPPGKSGIAHFLEHLMFKGTDTIPPGEFSKIVARNGGRDNAFTSWDYTGYFQNVARDKLELVMEMEADRMTGLILTEDVVLPERDVILEERHQVIDNRPAAVLGEQMRAAMYQNHPYGIPIIGWEHEIAALSREDALEFYDRFYRPANAILLVAGDITAAELKPMAEKYYGAIPAGVANNRVRPQEPDHGGARTVVLEDERVGQPRWTREYLAPSYVVGDTEHAYALQVLAEVLGGGPTSRLYQKLVVENQLVTSVGVSYDALNLGPSEFNLFALPRETVTLDEAAAGFMAEIDRVVAEGVGAEEVERAKDRLQAAAIYARDSLSAGVRVIGTALTSGQTVDDVEAWPDRIGEVTKAQVDAAARAVFVDDNSVTGILLPADDEKES
ncbi:MAG: insulinase family protein [Alphaproteobacteria bacterium]|nr:insulinase family protein [Alphaproteobacteria bacterium]